MQSGGLALLTARRNRKTVARAEWRGLSDLTPVLRRAALADAVKTVTLLHALCPLTHGVALLRAIEAAAALSPDEDQEAAREILCLGDGLAAQIWRSAVTWAKLAGHAPDMAAAAAARAAARDLGLALYPRGDWTRPGGGEVWPNADAIASVLSQFEAVLAGHRPTVPPIEPSRLGRFVAKRFATMASAPARTLARLKSSLPCARSCPMRPQVTDTSGHGTGTAMTARGPLIYSVRVAQGRLETVFVSAPSARRFAPNGRFARVAAAYARPSEFVFLAAAFDPCADIFVTETHHA
jgi:hypothetical protein